MLGSASRRSVNPRSGTSTPRHIPAANPIAHESAVESSVTSSAISSVARAPQSHSLRTS